MKPGEQFALLPLEGKRSGEAEEIQRVVAPARPIALISGALCSG